MEYLDLRELSARLSLRIDRLRYVLNQELVPHRDWFNAEDEVGRPRRFDLVTAVFIGCAAYLLEGGQKRDSVREIMRAIGRIQPDYRRNPLHLPILGHAVNSNANATVQVADGARVRWKVGRKDTGWIDPGPPLLRDDEFTPKVIVAMDFGLIRDLVRQSGTRS